MCQAGNVSHASRWCRTLKRKSSIRLLVGCFAAIDLMFIQKHSGDPNRKALECSVFESMFILL